MSSKELADLREASSGQARIQKSDVPKWTHTADQRGVLTPIKKSKYKAVRCVSSDGQKFDSKAEMRRWEMLKLMETQGYIRDIKRQTRFDLIVNGVDCGYYRCDFDYTNSATESRVVEDVKSVATRTPVYKLKKKLVFAIHGICIQEVS